MGVVQRPSAVAALLAALALAAVWPALGGGLLLDDPEVLASASRPLGDLLPALLDPVERPLARMSFLADRLWNPEAFDARHWGTMGHSAPPGAYAGIRAANAAIHAANAWLVWLLLSRWLLPGRPRAALLAATAFAVHPAAISTAAYIAQRGMLLSASGSLLACVGVFQGAERNASSRRKPLLLASAGIVLAAGSHPAGVLTPLLALGAFRMAGGRERLLPWVPAVGVALVLAAGVWGARRLAREGDEMRGAGRDPEALAAAQQAALPGDLGRMLLARPAPLDGGSVRAEWGWGPLAALAAGGVFLAGSARRAFAAGLGVLFLACLPLAVFPLKDASFSHRFYLALAGGAACLAALPPAGGRGLVAGLFLACVFLAGRGQARSLSTTLSAWADSARAAPRSARVQVNLGNGWALSGRAAQARAHYARALAIDPGHRGARENLKRLEDYSSRKQ